VAVVRIALRCQLAVTLWDHCSFRVFIDEFSDISLFLQILKLHSGLEEVYCYGGEGRQGHRTKSLITQHINKSKQNVNKTQHVRRHATR